MRLTKIGLKTEIAFSRAIALQELKCNKVVAVTMGLTDPILNLVLDIKTSEEELPDIITKVIQFYNQHKAQWRWIVGPLSKPTSLPQYLEDHGLVLIQESPAMHLYSSKIQYLSHLKNFTVKEVSSEDQLLEWKIPLLEVYSNSNNVNAYVQRNADIPHGPETSFHHYIGYFNDQVASITTLFTNNNAAMIHNVATIPKFQSRGFATVMLFYVMQEIKKWGLKHCFVNPSKESFKIFSKLGFKIYCAHKIYGFVNTSSDNTKSKIK